MIEASAIEYMKQPDEIEIEWVMEEDSSQVQVHAVRVGEPISLTFYAGIIYVDGERRDLNEMIGTHNLAIDKVQWTNEDVCVLHLSEEEPIFIEIDYVVVG